ncbi:MAG: hypothetical protein ACRDXX_14060, partial [Stackebrandtia sp.]
PYSAPASGVPGMPPPPPGYGQPVSAPGYGQPVSAMPGGPMPPQQSSNTGWIVGGIIGVVVIALAVVGTLFMTGVFGGDDDTENASDESESDGKDDSKEDENAEEEEDATSGDGGTYQYLGSLCDDVNIDAWLDGGVEQKEDVSASGGDYGTSSSNYCWWWLEGDEYAFTSLTIKIETFEDPEEAVSLYESSQTGDAWDGAWSEGALKDDSSSSTTLEGYVLDGNAMISATLSTSSDMSYSDPPGMLADSVEETLTLCAA